MRIVLKDEPTNTGAKPWNLRLTSRCRRVFDSAVMSSSVRPGASMSPRRAANTLATCCSSVGDSSRVAELLPPRTLEMTILPMRLAVAIRPFRADMVAWALPGCRQGLPAFNLPGPMNPLKNPGSQTTCECRTNIKTAADVERIDALGRLDRLRRLGVHTDDHRLGD